MDFTISLYLPLWENCQRLLLVVPIRMREISL